MSEEERKQVPYPKKRFTSDVTYQKAMRQQGRCKISCKHREKDVRGW